MAERVIFQEWRDRWNETKYPFSDAASLVNADGVEILPTLFDDARIFPIGGTAGAWLNRISLVNGVITFAVASPDVGELATGTYDLYGAAKDRIALTDAYGRPAGVLVSDNARLAALGGVYAEGATVTFEQDETEFTAAVVVPMPNVGVRGVLLDDGTLLAGDVWLVGEGGVVLRKESDTIRVDILGDPYAKRKDCEKDNVPTVPFCGLRTINLIPPDETGDFKITTGGNTAADNILRVENNNGAVKLKFAWMRNL